MEKNNKNTPVPGSAGTWRLINRVIEFQDTGEKNAEPWQGRMMIQPDGKLMLLMTKAGRTAPSTQAELAATLDGMVAASGNVRADGEVSVVTWDVAWLPQAIGMVFRTHTTVAGNRMHLVGEWGPNPGYANRSTRTNFEWERE